MAVKKKLPERMCVGCQKIRSKREMIRIVKSPDGEFSVDSTGKKSGRGAYICPNVDCLDAAIKGHKLEKSFRCSITDDTYEKLKAGFSIIDG